MNDHIQVDELNRLALVVMENRKITYDEALGMLSTFRLHIIVGVEARASIPLQAALLTVINAGKRAFLGGVTVEFSAEDFLPLVPWPDDHTSMRQIVEIMGATISKRTGAVDIPTLLLGEVMGATEADIKLVCNDWQAGILHGTESNPIHCTGTTPLAGIAAGAMGVGVAFYLVSGLDPHIQYQQSGISLWRPDLSWLDTAAAGPPIVRFPRKLWLLGLGHLGQAYLWVIGLFSFCRPDELEIVLQDFDKATSANWSAGLLTELSSVGSYKSRICSAWLEARGISTRLYERAFDDTLKLQDNEPLIALSGFDNAKARIALEKPGWALVVEAGVGGRLNDFDKIALHTFPKSYKTPAMLWSESMDQHAVLHPHVHKALETKDNAFCGIVAETVASTAISSSFVGTMAASFVLAELLRGLHGGGRYDTLSLHLRDLGNRIAFIHLRQDALEALTMNGYISLT